MHFINRFCYIIALILSIVLFSEFYLAVGGKIIAKQPKTSDYFTLNEKRFRDYVGWVSRLGYLYKSEEDPEVIIRIWPDGMRECRPDKDKSTDFNAAFIGCSCTFGEGVTAEETEVWRLNERYPEVTFDNWGVCGWGPVQMYARLKNILCEGERKYRLVVYNMLDDHKFRNYKRRALGFLNLNGVYVCCPYGNFDVLGRYRLHYAHDLYWPGEDNLLTVDFYKRIYYARCTDLFQKRYDREVCSGRDLDNAFDCYFEIVDRMRKLCDEHGVDFLVCNIQPPSLNSKVIHDPRFKSECINIDHPRSWDASLHVNGLLHNHPNGVVHAYWADRFAEWFDKRYEGYLHKRTH